MRIPSKEECFKLLCETDTMDHIAHHSFQVCRVAMCLTDKLAVKNIVLNRNLIEAAAILHDVTKTRSLTTGEKHSETGSNLLGDLGYPEVADLIRQHVRLDTYDSVIPSEAEIVNYSDKRVLRENIVSLEERMAYILERYGKTPESREYIAINRIKTQELENKLFAHLPFLPQELDKQAEADGNFRQFLDWRKNFTSVMKKC
jgi:putative nucleotidyltransferase with HDIG domain